MPDAKEKNDNYTHTKFRISITEWNTMGNTYSYNLLSLLLNCFHRTGKKSTTSKKSLASHLSLSLHGNGVRQEPGPDAPEYLHGQPQHEQYDRAEYDGRGDEAPGVPERRHVDHLLERREVRIVEIAQEPEHTGSQDLAQQQDERGEVVDVDHADEPVDEHGGAGGQAEGGLAVAEGRVEHGQGADVEPPAADQGQHADLDDAEQGDLGRGVRRW